MQQWTKLWGGAKPRALALPLGRACVQLGKAYTQWWTTKVWRVGMLWLEDRAVDGQARGLTFNGGEPSYRRAWLLGVGAEAEF